MGSLAVRDIDDLARVSKMIAAAGYFGVSPQQAAVKVMAGHELGIGPLQSMMNVHVIQGKDGRVKVTLAAGLIASLIKRSGAYRYRVTDSSAVQCSIEFESLHDGGVVIIEGAASFTIEEARQAGLADKQNWKRYPADMLFARALTRGARRFCPDVFGGPIYTPDEISGDPTGVPDMEVKAETVELGGDHDQDDVRDELMEDLITLRDGRAVGWLQNEIATDPIGHNSWFGEGVRWIDGTLDEKEHKAIRQRFHIWVKEAGTAYDDVRQWPLYAIKAQGVINFNRALRDIAAKREEAERAKAASDEDGCAGAVSDGDGPQASA